MNSNSPARSRELRHLELRGFLSPWTRDLKTGTVSRYDPTGCAIYSLPHDGKDLGLKVSADECFVALGFRLLNVPGGCQIEREP